MARRLRREPPTPDPGVLHWETGNVAKAAAAFAEAIAKHRHFERETLPPRV